LRSSAHAVMIDAARPGGSKRAATTSTMRQNTCTWCAREIAPIPRKTCLQRRLILPGWRRAVDDALAAVVHLKPPRQTIRVLSRGDRITRTPLEERTHLEHENVAPLFQQNAAQFRRKVDVIAARLRSAPAHATHTRSHSPRPRDGLQRRRPQRLRCARFAVGRRRR
jgi:hypothetical protein